MTYVTCPTLRYHLAVVAQKAATVQSLSGNRFRLGLAAGENLNEHVVGRRWPTVDALSSGPDVDAHVEAIKPFIDAGFTEVALVQIGGDHQEQFATWAEGELLPALRSL